MTSRRLIGLALAVGIAGLLPATAWSWQRSSPSYFGGLAVDDLGNAVLAGSTVADDGASDLFTVRKFSGADGTQLWSHAFQGDLTTAGTGNGGAAVVTTPSGDVLAGGTVCDMASGGDFAVVRLAGGSGAQMWKTVTDGAPLIPAATS